MKFVANGKELEAEHRKMEVVQEIVELQVAQSFEGVRRRFEMRVQLQELELKELQE